MTRMPNLANRPRRNPKGYELIVRDITPARLSDANSRVEWHRLGALSRDPNPTPAAYADIVLESGDLEGALRRILCEVIRDLLNDYEHSDKTEIDAVYQDVRHHAPAALIEMIEVVSESDRGKGLGSEMLRELESQLRAQGVTYLYLYAMPPERAWWYQRMGFSVLFPTAFGDALSDGSFSYAAPLMGKSL